MIKKIEGLNVIVVLEEKDVSTMDAFVTKESMERLTEWLTNCELGPCDTVIIDLKNIAFLDSTGISELIILNRMLTEQNKALRIINASRFIAKIFVVLGLEDVIPIEEVK